MSAHSENLDVSLEQLTLGGDITALKLFDPGYFSVGFGLRVGMDWVQQSFETRGRSPDRTSVTARAAPVLRVEAPITGQLSLAVSGVLDGTIVQDDVGHALNTVPGVEFGLTAVFQ